MAGAHSHAFDTVRSPSRAAPARRTTLSPAPSRPPGRRAAARRSSDGTSSARSPWRVSSAASTSRSPTGSPPVDAAVEDRDAGAHALEHARRPVRVGFSPTRGAAARARRAASRRRGTAPRRRCRRDVISQRRQPLGRRDGASSGRRAPSRPSARASARCGHGSGAARPTAVGPSSHRAPRAERTTSPARSRPAARSRSAAARRPSTVSGAWPSVVATRPHRAQRLGDPLHRAARQRLVADELERALLAGEDARAQPHERARVPAVERAGGLPEPAQARAVDAHRSPSTSTPAPSARDRGRGRERVAWRPEAVGSRSRPRRSRRAAARGAEIDLSPGTAMSPRSATAGSTRSDGPPHVARQAGRDDRPRSPAPRAARPRVARPRSPATRSVSVPPRSGERWCSSKSSMLIRSAPSACVIPARTPGRSGRAPAAAGARPASGYAPLEQPAAVAAGLADPAREKAGVAGLERALDLLDAPAVLGERAAERRRRCRGRCRPRSAGSRPPRGSCRAASRRRTPAARGRRRAPRRPGSTTTFASACGRWLVSATSRSCAPGSIATGTAPSEATKPCRSR